MALHQTIQHVVDQRASALYRSVGFVPEDPPKLPRLLQFGRAVLGAAAISFAGDMEIRGPALAAMDARAGRCNIRLHMGLPQDENVFGIARGLAQREVARGAFGIAVEHVERLALSIAMPRELMDWYHHVEGGSPERIARDLGLPLEVVRERERAFVKLRSVRRIAVAAAIPHAAAARVTAG